MSTNISKAHREDLEQQIAILKENLGEASDKPEVRKALGKLERELHGKKYGLVWEEHRENIDDVLDENEPVLTELPELAIEKAAEQPQNFLIEGDNLAALKLLEKTHRGKIDVIYIDPPYNRGGDLIYDDDYIDKDDTFKHSKFLSFIEKRLKIARELLAPNGFISISIDEIETSSIRLLCDEIFGENNLLSTHHIQVRYGNKNLNERSDFQELVEYVYIYAKNKALFEANKPFEEYSLDPFCWQIEAGTPDDTIVLGGKRVEIFKKGNYKITKQKQGAIGFMKETWASGSVVKGNASGKFFETQLKPRKEIDGLGTLYKVSGIGEDGLGYRYFTGPKKSNAAQGKFYSGVPLSRVKELETHSAKKFRPIVNFYDYSADFGNIRHEGKVPFNGGKKPVRLMKNIVNYHLSKTVTVLDFFAGSGSTGHSVMQLNSEDGGRRKYILVTNNQEDICRDKTLKRLNNAIEDEGYPVNLKYFRIDYVPTKDKFYDDYSDELLLHVKELVELENAIDFNSTPEIEIVLTDEELDELIADDIRLSKAKTLFHGHDVLFSAEQRLTLNNHGIATEIIPEYYYAEEM